MSKPMDLMVELDVLDKALRELLPNDRGWKIESYTVKVTWR